VTAYDSDTYDIVYFKSNMMTVEFYKDRNYRSIYEISVTVYHNGMKNSLAIYSMSLIIINSSLYNVIYIGDSPICRKDGYHRCSTNTSMCIDEDLLCDKFTQCPNDSDEDQCGPASKSILYYTYEKR
jgi:hypothetical protein